MTVIKSDRPNILKQKLQPYSNKKLRIETANNFLAVTRSILRTGRVSSKQMLKLNSLFILEPCYTGPAKARGKKHNPEKFFIPKGNYIPGKQSQRFELTDLSKQMIDEVHREFLTRLPKVKETKETFSIEKFRYHALKSRKDSNKIENALVLLDTYLVGETGGKVGAYVFMNCTFQETIIKNKSYGRKYDLFSFLPKEIKEETLTSNEIDDSVSVISITLGLLNLLGHNSPENMKLYQDNPYAIRSDLYYEHHHRKKQRDIFKKLNPTEEVKHQGLLLTDKDIKVYITSLVYGQQNRYKEEFYRDIYQEIKSSKKIILDAFFCTKNKILKKFVDISLRGKKDPNATITFIVQFYEGIIRAEKINFIKSLKRDIKNQECHDAVWIDDNLTTDEMTLLKKYVYKKTGILI